MKYRKFGKTDFQASALGFGCMRFPADKTGAIDEKETVRMLRYAIDNGVNYIDTAYGYHNGMSEIVTGKALIDGYRQRVKLATKSPVWFINEPRDFDKYLDEQLGKLQTDHIDYYLLHGLNLQSWQKILKLEVLTKAEGALKSGKIGNIGFSFHDNFDVFREIVDGYGGWVFCQIQYNYMDIENQAGMKGLRYAASRGLGVIVMEPLLGGRLANPPEDVSKIIDSSGIKRSAVGLALQWIWDQPEVSLILSGMNTMEQTVQNLRLADLSNSALTRDETDLINKIRNKYLERYPIPCTKCNYCMPCPNGVDIPANFELYNNGISHEDMNRALFLYRQFMPEKERAGQCIQCGICTEKCPQNIDIGSWMTKVHAALG